MGHSVPCILIIAFVFVDLLSAGTFIFTPGACPRDHCECVSDENCGPGKKCCRKSCNEMMCLNVKEPCPSIPHLDCDKCKHDRDCEFGVTKCCYRNCKKQCVEPITDIMHPGFCPHPFVLRCHKCYSSEQCSRWGMLCCDVGCGRACKPPEHGECPPAVGELCDECFSDADCDGCKKCCHNFCGFRVCTDGQFRRKRKCDQCSYDCQCPRDQLCCNDGCKQRCMPTFRGKCPDNFKHDHECSSDADCREKCEKCKCAGCKKRCVKIDFCPECDIDRDCSGRCEKCRFVGYLRKCVNEQRVNPRCDSLPFGCSKCSPGEKCWRGQLCCDAGCGFYTCVAAVNGRCPPPNDKDCCCSDLDCKRPQKCCVQNCEKRCAVPPDVSNPFTCPINFLPPGCWRCSKDGESNPCRSGQKCCDIGCGFTICQPAEYGWKCPRVERTGCCRSNKDCRHGQICCEKGCGTRCINTDFENHLL